MVITIHVSYLVLCACMIMLYCRINRKAIEVRDSYFTDVDQSGLSARLGGLPKDWLLFFALTLLPLLGFILFALGYVEGVNDLPTVRMLIACISIYGVFRVIRVSCMRFDFPVKRYVERLVLGFMFVAALIAVLTTFGIVLSLVKETIQFAKLYSFIDFLFGTSWSPQVAFRADQAGATGALGMIPLMVGTLLITFIALCIAVPMGLGAAIYLSEYASPQMRRFAKPVLEILSGIPTVVYGFLTVVIVAPLLRGWGQGIGLDVSSESALAVGIVMGVMIIPYISSLSDDVLNAVPQTLRDGSLAVGATKVETVLKIILPAALPGIVSAFILAFSRAIGETMIVVMAAGLSANLTVNPFDAVTTMTVQIATLLTGDQEFDSVKTLSAFALGMVLFCITLALNMIALNIVHQYRKKYV